MSVSSYKTCAHVTEESHLQVSFTRAFTFAITCCRVTNSNDGDASHSFADDVQALKREYFPISVGYSNALIDSEDAEFIQV